MHPILFQRGRLTLYLLAWAVVASILATLSVKSGSLTWAQSIALSVPMSLVYAFLCLASFYLVRAFPLQKTGYARLFGVYAVSSFISSSLWIMVAKGLATLLNVLIGFPPLAHENEQVVRLFFLFGLLLFLLAVFMNYLLLAVEESRVKERHALEQSVLAREAELRALRAQIQPHFLFNSLNSISALTTVDAAGARNMSLHLADFLRKTLRFGGSDRISLQEEIGLAEDYLTIEKTRFGSRLKFEKHVEEQALGCLIPPLILQPLVENAVNHGISLLPEGGTIRLDARTDGQKLFVGVENPCDPDYAPRKQGGVGLDNVRRRLAAMHGGSGSFRAEKTSDVYRAEIVLPVGRRKD